MDVLFGFILIVVFYFLPTFIGKGKVNAGAIFTLNLLAGWTFVGWIGSLIWAMVAKPELEPQPVIAEPEPVLISRAAAPSGIATQLEKLSEMYAQGILTEAEFEAA